MAIRVVRRIRRQVRLINRPTPTIRKQSRINHRRIRSQRHPQRNPVLEDPRHHWTLCIVPHLLLNQRRHRHRPRHIRRSRQIHLRPHLPKPLHHRRQHPVHPCMSAKPVGIRKQKPFKRRRSRTHIRDQMRIPICRFHKGRRRPQPRVLHGLRDIEQVEPLRDHQRPRINIAP